MKRTAGLTLSAWLLLFGFLSAGCSAEPSKDRKATHRERGLAYVEKGQYQEALIEFKNVVQADPKDADAHYRLALIYLKLGGLPNLQAAFGELTKSTELDPSNKDAQLKLGSMYLLSSKPDKALERADVVLASSPQNVDGLVLKGQSLISERQYDKGIQELKKAIELDPKNIRIRLDLAKSYVAMKDMAAAQSTLQEALAIDPKSTEVRVALADLRTLMGQLSEAEAEYKQIIETNPDEGLGYLRLAGFYQSIRRWLNAEQTLQQLAARKPKDENAHIILGDFYTFTGQWDKAQAEYQQALDLNPPSLPARNKVIDILLLAGKLDEAEGKIKAVLDKNPRDVEGRFFDARLRLSKGKPDEAIDLLQRVLKDEPRSPGAHYYLGLAFLAKTDRGQARRELDDAIKNAPAMYEARTALAAIHLAEGSIDLAIEQAQAAIQLNPLKPQPVIILGDTYIRKNDLAKAKAVYESFIKAAPKEALGYFKLGVIARLEKHDGQAVAHFEEALSANPNFADALTQLVMIKLSQGKPHEARDRVIKQLALAPKNPVMYNIQGRLLAQMKDYALAEASFRKAVELAPDLSTSYFYLADLYRMQGKADQAIKEYQDLLAKNPKLLSAHFLLGVLHEQQKQFDKAKEHYEAALKVDPKFAPAANNLAYYLADTLGDPDQALPYAETARASAPDDPSIADTLGWIYYKKKTFKRAAELLKEAAEKLTDNPIVQYHYGMAQFMVGDNVGAKRYLQAALKLSDKFPGSDEARQTLKSL